MHVLMLSLDPKMANPNSSVRLRHREYAKKLEELTLLVLADTEREEKIVEENLIIFTPGKRSKSRIKMWAELHGTVIAEDYALKGNGIVTSPDPFLAGLLAYKLARRFRLPLQLQLHTDILDPSFWHESWKNKFYFYLARFLLPRAQGVRVVSERIKISLIQDPRFKIQDSKISVLPVFIDTERFRTAATIFNLRQKYLQFEKIILWIGRLTREKNPALAIEIFSKIHTSHPTWGLIIVGDGPERKRLESRVRSQESVNETLELKTKNYNLKTSVIFTGWQSDLIAYYRGADVLLVTSDYEGYGMQIVEALASGCPVVSTDVGIAREAGASVFDNSDDAISILSKVIESGCKVALNEKFLLSKEEYLNRMYMSFERCLVVETIEG